MNNKDKNKKAQIEDWDDALRILKLFFVEQGEDGPCHGGIRRIVTRDTIRRDMHDLTTIPERAMENHYRVNNNPVRARESTYRVHYIENQDAYSISFPNAEGLAGTKRALFQEEQKH